MPAAHFAQSAREAQIDRTPSPNFAPHLARRGLGWPARARGPLQYRIRKAATLVRQPGDRIAPAANVFGEEHLFDSQDWQISNVWSRYARTWPSRTILVCGLASLGLLPVAVKRPSRRTIPPPRRSGKPFICKTPRSATVRPRSADVDRQGQPLVEVAIAEPFGNLAIRPADRARRENEHAGNAGRPTTRVRHRHVHRSGAGRRQRPRRKRHRWSSKSRPRAAKKSRESPGRARSAGFGRSNNRSSRKPLAPGEKRSLKMLMPLAQPGRRGGTCGRRSRVDLGAGRRSQACCESTSSPNCRAIKRSNSTVWTDSQGETIKTRIDALEQESFRTTREIALAPPTSDARFDLGSDLVVKLPQPLADPHQRRLVRYRVELAGGDPAKVFASGPTQSVAIARRPHGDRDRAEPAARRSAGRNASEFPASPVAGKEYSTANSVLQIDDPRVRQMAREAKGDATDPAQIALALERYVHQRDDQEELLAGVCDRGRSGRIARGRLHRTRRAVGGAGPGLRHSVARGDRSGLRRERRRIWLSHVDRNVSGRQLDAAGRDHGPGGHRRGAPEADRFQPGRRDGL